MSDVDLALLFGLVLASAASYRNPRGILWLGLAAIDFIASTAYWRSGLPYAEGIAGACDAAVCLAVYFAGRERWEMGVWRLMQVSVAINFLYLAGNIGVFGAIPHEVYSIMLEAVNWLLILFIGGMGIMQRIGVSNAGAHRPWSRVRRFGMALRAERAEPSFLHKA